MPKHKLSAKQRVFDLLKKENKFMCMIGISEKLGLRTKTVSNICYQFESTEKLIKQKHKSPGSNREIIYFGVSEANGIIRRERRYITINSKLITAHKALAIAGAYYA